MTDTYEKTVTETVFEDAINIMPNESNNQLQYSQTYNVKTPKTVCKILLDEECVKKIKKECEIVRKERFPYSEVFLGVASLLLGAFLGALFSQVPYEFSWLSILSYSICPIGGCASGVAYFFCRKKSITDIKQFAEKVEEQFENINIDEGVEQENEH